MPDHPRVRGEHTGRASDPEGPVGSSPRARGTRVRVVRQLLRRRIIPACAGNTLRAVDVARIQPDHPRVRGEHGLRLRFVQHVLGSSPRARGTRARSCPPRASGRIIPACAGNTGDRAMNPDVPPDHPRVRGEHCTSVRGCGVHPGSSPRARGTPRCRPTGCAGRRIIPACAGNTPSPAARAPRTADHPRVRGEHDERGGRGGVVAGSSPRARGTRDGWRPCTRHRRIIPACAGNTAGSTAPVLRVTDHPRVRGEHRSLYPFGCQARGSSPRARGTQCGPASDDLMTRIIPACAGNTAVRFQSTAPRADHPRVRGEHLSDVTRDGHGIGSSPRARGTQRRAVEHAALERIIPACAGNTGARASPAAAPPDHPRVRGEHA